MLLADVTNVKCYICCELLNSKVSCIIRKISYLRISKQVSYIISHDYLRLGLDLVDVIQIKLLCLWS